MSGGRYEYRQYGFTDVIDDLKRLIEQNGKPKTKEEMKAEFYHYDADWYEKYPENKFHYKYPDNVIEEFKNAIDIISRAQVYMHRVDWLLSGDDGDESFIKRLNEELKKL
jgi:hypothetical protein